MNEWRYGEMPLGGQSSVRRLALFDLDGTLVRGDSFLPFLVTYARRNRRWTPLIQLPAVVALYGLRVLRDRTAKQHLLRGILRGEPRSRIESHTSWFLDQWVKSRLKSQVLTRLQEHQRRGDYVVLVSASPDIYVRAIGEKLGCDASVSTVVEFAGETCDGSLVGANCKGEHKVEFMKRFLGAEAAAPDSSAYGDSGSDLPLLKWVDHGFWVRGEKIVRLADSRLPGTLGSESKPAREI